jgi:hypothetical protein
MNDQFPRFSPTTITGAAQQWVEQPQPFIQKMPGFLTTLTPMYLSLLAQARELASDQHKQYQFAVVLCQAACELATEQTLIALMRLRGADFLTDAILGSTGQSKTLANPRVLKVFIALTAECPKEATWWKAWEKSRELRHAVAHEGVHVRPDEATASIEAASAYVQYLNGIVQSIASMRSSKPYGAAEPSAENRPGGRD